MLVTADFLALGASVSIAGVSRVLVILVAISSVSPVSFAVADPLLALISMADAVVSTSSLVAVAIHVVSFLARLTQFVTAFQSLAIVFDVFVAATSLVPHLARLSVAAEPWQWYVAFVECPTNQGLLLVTAFFLLLGFVVRLAPDSHMTCSVVVHP